MVQLSNRPICSWSWQEIELVYAQYGSQLIELARIKKVFGFNMIQRGVFPGQYMFDFAQDHFNRNVDEVDGMLALLDAEIKRRNNLIGVMG